MAMAPLCVCGHRASEHHKFSNNIRTFCTREFHDAEEPGVVDGVCGCLMYRAKEEEQ